MIPRKRYPAVQIQWDYGIPNLANWSGNSGEGKVWAVGTYICFVVYFSMANYVNQSLCIKADKIIK